LNTEIALRDGKPDWDETFYEIGLTGTPNIVFMVMLNAISAFVSTLIVIVFLLALLTSKAVLQITQKIPALQNFIDTHTSVQDKPLQVLSLFAIGVFTVIFWVLYAITRL
jgi:hypothetical protein